MNRQFLLLRALLLIQSCDAPQIIGLQEDEFTCNEADDQMSDFTLAENPDVMQDVTPVRTASECEFTDQALKGFTRNDIKYETTT